MSRKRLVIGNWKMYVGGAEEATVYARALKRKLRGLSGVDVALSVPTPFISAVADIFESSPVHVGGQSLSQFDAGAHTGEVSARMLKSAGADFCLVGHSERRAMGESNEAVHRQLVEAASAGLRPVLCVGEMAREEDGAYISFIAEQLRSALTGAQSLSQKLVIAYEPVWAIGKQFDAAMKPSDVHEMAIFIRKTLADVLGRTAALKIPILYGGSVEPENARTLIVEGDINGLLVGHASVELDSFLQILSACKK